MGAYLHFGRLKGLALEWFAAGDRASSTACVAFRSHHAASSLFVARAAIDAMAEKNTGEPNEEWQPMCEYLYI